jgi:hypothetical protein
MSPVRSAALLAVGALAFWLLGGVVCRVGGLVNVVAGMAGLIFMPGPEAIGFLLLGALMWLLGQLHHAFRHGAYRGPPARRILFRSVPPGLRFDTASGRRRGGGPGRS